MGTLSNKKDSSLKSNKYFSKPNKGMKGKVLTFLYFFLLANLFLLTLEIKSEKFYSNEANYEKSNSEVLKNVFLTFLDTMGEGGIIYILVIPLILTIAIHSSFRLAIYTLIIALSIFLSIVALIVTKEELGYVILGTVYIFFISLAITAMGIVMRAYYNIEFKPTRIVILLSPVIIPLLMIAFYLII